MTTTGLTTKTSMTTTPILTETSSTSLMTSATTTELTTSLNQPCNPNPCQNGGVCIILDEKFECECPPGGIIGSVCEIPEVGK